MAERRTIFRFRSLCACVVSLAAGFCLARVDAQPTDMIDRPVVIYVAGTAGGGIDLYARLVARHLGRHIPGNPSVTVQVMPGARGIRAAYHLSHAAPRDGTALATFAGRPAIAPPNAVRQSGYHTSP